MEAIGRGIQRRTVFTISDSLRQRFLCKVCEQGKDKCWPWLGAIRNGYGCIKHDNGLLSAHVVAWVIEHNRLPADGMLICHTCDNRTCCNPAHLYEGSYADNVHDADKRRRIPRPHGTQVPNAVLTDDVCRLVMSLNIVRNIGPWVIADLLGYHRRTIEKVLYAETWKHVAVPSSTEALNIVAHWEATRSPASSFAGG